MEILPAIFIYLIVPLIGLGLFLWLRQRMLNDGTKFNLLIEYFLLFTAYGGLLLVVLTSIFWKWSGLASLGVFYLVFVAPVIMGVIAYRNSKQTKDSIYHFWAHRLAILYFLIALVVIGFHFVLLDTF